MDDKFEDLLHKFEIEVGDYYLLDDNGRTNTQSRDEVTLYVDNLQAENARLREENALIRAQLNEVLLWHPFSEERPPYDESRYAVRSMGDKKYWCWLPPMPEVVQE